LRALESQPARPAWYRALPALAFGWLIACGLAPLPQQFSFMSIAFVLLTVGLSQHPWRLFVNPLMSYLGKISFSSYLTHFVVLEVLEHAGAADWVTAEAQLHAVRFLIFYVVAVAVTAALASLTYRLIEVPGQNLGRQLLRQQGWEGRKRAVASAEQSS
jgi:peptidoglycan/LPS O-acetylase OafA/YrhL